MTKKNAKTKVFGGLRGYLAKAFMTASLAVATVATPSVAQEIQNNPFEFAQSESDMIVMTDGDDGNNNVFNLQFQNQSQLDLRESPTEHSQRILDLQTLFNNAVQDRTIVFIDRDWFQINFSNNSNDAYTNARILSEYIEERTGKEIDPAILAPFVRYVATGAGVTFPMGEVPTLDGDTINLNIVIGHWDDKDAETSMREFMNLHSAIVGPLANEDLKLEMDLDVLKRFIDYHESGHAMDDWYVRQSSEALSPNDYLYMRHKAEVFAEVFSLYMMAREGNVDHVEALVNMRIIAGVTGGPLSVQSRSPADPSAYGAYTYMLHEGIRGAFDEISQMDPQDLANMSLQEIQQRAHAITERCSFDDEISMKTFTYLFRNNYDLTELENTRHSSAEAQQMYDRAVEIRESFGDALDAMFDLSRHNLTADNVLDNLPLTMPAQSAFPQGPNRQVIMSALGRLLQEAGGQSSVTVDSMIEAVSERKDELRRILEDGTDEAAMRSAREELSLMPHIVFNAVSQAKSLEDARGHNATPSAPSNDNDGGQDEGIHYANILPKYRMK